MKRLILKSLVGISLSFFLVTVTWADPLYLSNTLIWESDGEESNVAALDAAFGTGNWEKSTDWGGAMGLINSGAHDYVYVDGGDGATDNFESFVNANRTALENWVFGGGSLWLNMAQWGGTRPFDMGFGATLYYRPSSAATAVDGSHAIFNGPVAATGTSFTGTAFSHNYLTGAGFTALIQDSASRAVLMEMSYGAGHIMVGGITTCNFHSPQPAACDLRANTFAYGAAQTAVPEPATLALMGLGLAGIGFARKKKRA